jgi:cell fate (sporulation/competence/biofilm development) regulator YmcA (YheA/YmcA/DUF963 family)
MAKEISEAELQNRIRNKQERADEKRHKELLSQLRVDFTPILKENSEIVRAVTEAAKLNSKEFVNLIARIDKQTEAMHQMSAKIELLTTAINRKPSEYEIVKDNLGRPVKVKAIYSTGN